MVRAELRVLLETLKHELELDARPPELDHLPIDAVWDEFAVEEPLLQVAFACYDEAFVTEWQPAAEDRLTPSAH